MVKNYISDKELENLLNSREFEPASKNLAYKIITKARNKKYAQEENLPIWDILKELFLPKQLIPLMMALMLGLYLGGVFSINISEDEYQISNFYLP